MCALGLILESVTIPKGVNELKAGDTVILVESNWNSLCLEGVSCCDRNGGDVVVN